MSELADRIRARHAGGSSDGWFRKEPDALGTSSFGGPDTGSPFSDPDSEPVEARVYVVPSEDIEEATTSDQPGHDIAPSIAPSSGLHALARKRPFWLTEPCPSWCQADHSERDRPADRRHVSAPHGSVVLTEAEASPSGDGTWQPQDIHVALSQHVREVEPLITCGGHGPAGSWNLTVDEARDLAAALTRAVEATERR
jgi:hypothetical protein